MRSLVEGTSLALHHGPRIGKSWNFSTAVFSCLQLVFQFFPVPYLTGNSFSTFPRQQGHPGKVTNMLLAHPGSFLCRTGRMNPPETRCSLLAGPHTMFWSPGSQRRWVIGKGAEQHLTEILHWVMAEEYPGFTPISLHSGEHLLSLIYAPTISCVGSVQVWGELCVPHSFANILIMAFA